MFGSVPRGRGPEGPEGPDFVRMFSECFFAFYLLTEVESSGVKAGSGDGM